MGAALAANLRDIGGGYTQEQRSQDGAEGRSPLGIGKATGYKGSQNQLKGLFTSDAIGKTLSGLFTRLVAKIAAYTCGHVSTIDSGGHCATWPTFSSEHLYISCLRESCFLSSTE